MITDDKFWRLQRGDLIMVEGEDGIKEIVEFMEHIYDGAIFYKSFDKNLWETATRDEIYTIIIKGEY